MNTRPNTPDRTNPDGSFTITTKRVCNGCSQMLGDITEAEMNAAIAGRPLPDVRSECPACAPTAPAPRCVAAGCVSGDMLCVELECDHDSGDGGYCTEVRQELICDTHSTSAAAESGYDEITLAEPWPC